MYEITEQPFETYEAYKNTMDQAVGATVQNIVKIGYLLKVARDTGILQESGYTTMRDFAQAEYNIDASMASRFIGINDRYSVGGNSMTLDEKYTGYETSKLAEMLTLPDAIIEEIPPEMKRDEIREIKGQLKEEEKTSDMEVLIEKCETEPSDDSDLAAVLKQTLEENFEMFKEIDKLIYDGCKHEELYEALAPAGYAALIGRIPGKGRMMLSIKSLSEAPVLINTRTNEKEEYTWDQIFDDLDYFIKYPNDTPDPEKDYKETFGHDPKKENKKPSAVTVSEKAKPKTDKKPQKANEKPQKAEWTEPKLEELPEKEEEPEEAAGEEVPFPDGEEPEITHVSPEDSLPEEESEAAGVEEEIAPAQPEEIEVLSQRELERIANGLRSLADQFEAGSGGNLYSNPIEELEGMRSEIMTLPGELLPVIEDAIRRKRAV